MRLYVLIPILAFMGTFLGSGLYFTFIGAPMAFYKVSAITCAAFALFLTVLLDKGKLEERVQNLNTGLGGNSAAGIIPILILAGGFSGVTQGSGCMQEAVTAIMTHIAPPYVISCLFLLTCLAALGLGTSMGVISLLGPFAVELSQGNTHVALWCLGAVVSGAAFGDNLSIISDTSIASSQTVGVCPRSKFLANLPPALCACLGVLCVYVIFGAPDVYYVPLCSTHVSYWQLLPYLTIIVISLLGIPVLYALFITTLLTLALNIILRDYTFIKFSADWMKGLWSMMPITVLTFLLSGLHNFIVRHGGISFLEKTYKSPYRAEIVIAKMGVICTILFANNTVAILFAGHSVKNIVKKNNLSPAVGASLLDIFATVTKCAIPHGTQLLLASSLIGCSPLSVIPYCVYSFALSISALILFHPKVTILRGLRKQSSKD